MQALCLHWLVVIGVRLQLTPGQTDALSIHYTASLLGTIHQMSSYQTQGIYIYTSPPLCSYTRPLHLPLTHIIIILFMPCNIHLYSVISRHQTRPHLTCNLVYATALRTKKFPFQFQACVKWNVSSCEILDPICQMKLNCIDPINVGTLPRCSCTHNHAQVRDQEGKVRDNFTFHNQLQIKIRVAFDK